MNREFILMEKRLKKVKKTAICAIFSSLVFVIACGIKIYTVIKMLPDSNLSLWKIIEYGTSLDSHQIEANVKGVDVIIMSNIYQGIICLVLFILIVALICNNFLWIKRVHSLR